MAVFSAPEQHNNDPERAVRAALEMQEVIKELMEVDTPTATLAVRGTSFFSWVLNIDVMRGQLRFLNYLGQQ